MLKEVGVMDYSLLFIMTLIIKIFVDQFGDPRFARKIVKSNNKKYIYIFGLIDYLQKFNVAKFLENKSILYGNEIKYVSAVDPIIHSERMLNFAIDYIFISRR
jgi:hypothetical protein